MRKIASHLKSIFLFRYFILGISITFFIHFTGSCNKEDNAPDDNPGGNTYVDAGKISEGSKSVETAFISGDASSIKNILTDDAKAFYDADLSKIKKNNLIKLGEALKSRELKIYTDLYAEYIYTMNGVKFSMAMARQEDGSWKLMRF